MILKDQLETNYTTIAQVVNVQCLVHNSEASSWDTKTLGDSVMFALSIVSTVGEWKKFIVQEFFVCASKWIVDTFKNSWSYSNFSRTVIFVSLHWYFDKLRYSVISENKLSSTCWKNKINMQYTIDFITILMVAF